LTKRHLKVSSLVGARINSKQSIAIFGENHSGKTHFVHTLAKAFVISLGIVKLNSERDISSIMDFLKLI
jgi:ABC-type branched-subunit amino acid transport system ATPase component